MRSDVIVVNLVAGDDWSFGLLESSHDFLSVADFTVEPFHLVVLVALDSDVVCVVCESPSSCRTPCVKPRVALQFGKATQRQLGGVL